MNELTKHDLDREIAESIIEGESVDSVSKRLSLPLNRVYSVIRSADFLEECTQALENNIKNYSLKALRNIKEIAESETASAATRLKANAYLIDKALEIGISGGGDYALHTMSQSELEKRLDQLHREASKRAKRVDGVIIEQDAPQTIEDMF